MSKFRMNMLFSNFPVCFPNRDILAFLSYTGRALTNFLPQDIFAARG